MISVDDALKTVLKSIKILPRETVELTDALGRVLAQDLYADYNIPQFDNSAMDGYAIKSADTKEASKDNPKILDVVEDIKAGYIAKHRLKNNQAIRIMTGAPMPKGADSVVMVEDTETPSVETRVKIFKEVELGENVRKAGEDIKRGELVIPKGARLKPAHIGLLASLGKANVQVAKRPKIAILATGDEVVAVGAHCNTPLPPGKLRSSNTYTLYSQVLKCGGIPKNLGIARDNPRQIEKKIKQGLDCDLILTSGGVSVGDYDLVKGILARMGTNIRFWKVAMRPGKPLVFGVIEGIPVFGLPGNPVSSMVSFEVFVRPAILKMSGRKDILRSEVEAVLGRDVEKKKGLRYFIRANTRWQQGRFAADVTGPQGSAILSSMALANSLIVLFEDDGCVKKGKMVTVRFLD